MQKKIENAIASIKNLHHGRQGSLKVKITIKKLTQHLHQELKKITPVGFHLENLPVVFRGSDCFHALYSDTKTSGMISDKIDEM